MFTKRGIRLTDSPAASNNQGLIGIESISYQTQLLIGFEVHNQTVKIKTTLHGPFHGYQTGIQLKHSTESDQSFNNKKIKYSQLQTFTQT